MLSHNIGWIMRRGPLNGWSLNHKTASSWRVTSPDLNAVHAIIQFPVFSIKLTTSESLESLPVLHHKFFPTDVHQDVCAHGMYQSIRTQVRKLSTCCSCNTLESLFGALVVSDLAKKNRIKRICREHGHKFGCSCVHAVGSIMLHWLRSLRWRCMTLSHRPGSSAQAPQAFGVPLPLSCSPCPTLPQQTARRVSMIRQTKQASQHPMQLRNSWVACKNLAFLLKVGRCISNEDHTGNVFQAMFISCQLQSLFNSFLAVTTTVTTDSIHEILQLACICSPSRRLQDSATFTIVAVCHPQNFEIVSTNFVDAAYHGIDGALRTAPKMRHGSGSI